MTREQALVEHLATKVMGWHKEGRPAWLNPVWCNPDGVYQRNCNLFDPDSWADAGMVLEAARKQEGLGDAIYDQMAGVAAEQGYCSFPLLWIINDATPRAICEAIAKATGWEEPAV